MTNEDAPKKTARRRRLPRWWAAMLMLIPVAGIVWFQVADPMGDAGMANGFSYMLFMLFGAIVLIWFLFFARGYRFRTRILTVLGLFVVLFGLSKLVRVEGFTGSMIPVVSWSWTPQPAEAAAAPVANAAAVDLATTSEFDFPGFLGPRRDQFVANVDLANDWSSTPPEVLWRQPIGSGWSAFAVVNGVAVTQEERDGRQMVTAYEAETGELLWTHTWPGKFDHPLGLPGPRSTPTIDEGLVYAVGPFGRFVCLDGADGTLRWETELAASDVVMKTTNYGRSNSPLVHSNLVIVPVGGAAGSTLVNLTAFEKKTGEPVWNGSPHQIGYASPSVATLGGVEQVIIVNESAVTGHAVDTGRLLWEHAWKGNSNNDANNSQAVPIGPSSVFVSKAYGLGCARLDLEPNEDGTFTATQRWRRRGSLRTKHTNVVVRDGHAYGLSEGMLECVELENGKRAWKEGRYGHGQILGVGSHLLVLSEYGELALLGVSPEGVTVLGEAAGVDGLTWNNLALSRDLLFVRNGHEAAVLRLPLATR